MAIATIPRQLIVDVVEEYMGNHPNENLSTLSMSMGQSKYWLGSLLNNENENISLGVADKVLCKLGSVHLWWEPPLEEYYWEDQEVPPDKSKPVQCVMPDCDNWFDLPPPTVSSQGYLSYGSWNRKYCSETCNTRAWAHRNAVNMPRDKYCMNGHERTEENTRVETKNGRSFKRCMICHEESRARYTETRAKRQKVITPEQRTKWREQKRRQRAKNATTS
jgi:hypothetical protein